MLRAVEEYAPQPTLKVSGRHANREEQSRQQVSQDLGHAKTEP